MIMKGNFDIEKRTKEIANYIIEKYPQSCISQNSKNDTNNGWVTVSINGVSLRQSSNLREQCEDFFYFEKLNWCGCGNPEIVKYEILKYLRIKDWWYDIDYSSETYKLLSRKFREAFGVNDVYGSPLLLALAYTLDAAGFTEHGSSIGGAWITDEGRMFMFLLENNPDVVNE